MSKLSIVERIERIQFFSKTRNARKISVHVLCEKILPTNRYNSLNSRAKSCQFVVRRGNSLARNATSPSLARRFLRVNFTFQENGTGSRKTRTRRIAKIVYGEPRSFAESRPISVARIDAEDFPISHNFRSTREPRYPAGLLERNVAPRVPRESRFLSFRFKDGATRTSTTEERNGCAITYRRLACGELCARSFGQLW